MANISRAMMAALRRTREVRQDLLVGWATDAFGESHVTNPRQRAVRFLEEAVELYQAAGADPEIAHKLIDYVFGRPVGNIEQELGGVGVTLLLLGASAGANADECEIDETVRVLSKGAAHFTDRNIEKNKAGFDVTGAYPTVPAYGPGSITDAATYESVECRYCDNGRQQCFTHRSSCPKRIR